MDRVVDGDREGTTASFRIEARGEDLRAKLFRVAVDKGWTLLELHAKDINLEDIFRQLTRDVGDQAPKQAA